ncbi:acetyl-CoA carboxylase, carboxyltransferase subunit beta [Bacillus horti]|uniref:Acetyl-coenzyme A carboxylase carboxyl transferase subunit beta n=1 Tax=Caldalkalibacillus horti TaxID=77523 RepID=A0ABT9VT76_9BACI|nr:acetyl-CoA carboxylase, carboxyltransferase subunit beta [Bacillus horti]MDQ0164188.1 acetyl-CoA carboxylase carboxyl transferase subunit beta [Bacillus horti]
MLKDLFGKKRKYATIPSEQAKKEIPEGLMVKCKQCGSILYTKELTKNLHVCSTCQFHFPLSAAERLAILLDGGEYQEIDADMISVDPLGFPDYADRLAATTKKTGLNEAIITCEGKIKGHPVVVGVMDSRFIMASMGSVVGEKITNAIEQAIEKKIPFLLFSASGGARMQEGILSLMQMAKTSAALSKLDKEKGLFISILTHPTYGGVSASFASLGDYNIAEPGALIGFAGRRVIEQTIRQKLPEDFQTAEFQLKHGQLDMIVERKELRDQLGTILEIHST